VRVESHRVSPWFLLLVVITVAGALLTVTGTPSAATGGSSVMLTAGIVLLVLGGWAVSLCLHEFGHAAVAYRGGDRSVRAKGYLTLDIRRYTDLGLSFVLPILILLIGGIPLPGGAVWINHAAIRSRGARSLVSLAGPATNRIAVGLSCLAFIQVIAFVLNIIPIPGLDGFGVIEPFLPLSARQLAAKVRGWAPLVLFLLIIGVPGVSTVFFQVGGTVFAAVGGNASLAFAGYSELLFWR
jgi:Zn-dependent protease